MGHVGMRTPVFRVFSITNDRTTDMKKLECDECHELKDESKGFRQESDVPGYPDHFTCKECLGELDEELKNTKTDPEDNLSDEEVAVIVKFAKGESTIDQALEELEVAKATRPPYEPNPESDPPSERTETWTL